MRRWQLPVGALLGLALLTTGCSDDGTQVTTDGGTGSAASGLAGEDLSGTTDNPLVLNAVSEYKAYAAKEVDDAVRLTLVLTDAVRAGDLAAAQAAYAPSRVPWERVEPLAGLVEEIDGKVDARVDDFASVEDPAFTGWHRLEYLIFAQNTTEGGAAFADQLDADLATLKTQFATLEVPPVAVPVGAAELIEEVSQGKITGEEDRYSKTDLWDFNANLEGSRAAIERLTPALRDADPALLEKIEKGFADLDASLAPLRVGDGWQLYCLEGDRFPSPRCTGVTVAPATIATLQAQLAGLSENVSLTAGVLGLT
ncbi:MAG: EfeM/EfeO family lipoprotein [Pseudonocardia sp.]